MQERTPLILRGDARQLPLPDASVDLIVTSPPYFGLRDYGTTGQLGAEPTPAEYIYALIASTREWMRALKPSGSIFVNLGDKYDKDKSLLMLPERYRIAARDELGLVARAVIVWSKPNGRAGSVDDRVNRSHEDWVHLVKSPRYYAAMDEIREAYAPAPKGKHDVGSKNGAKVLGAFGHGNGGRPNNRTLAAERPAPNPRGKLPGSVWDVSPQPLVVPPELGVDHYAPFPMELPRRLILGWSPVGGTVLDPFGGTGTTALVATMLGRQGISVDLSEDYCRLARWRVNDPKQRERAALPAARKPNAIAKITPQLPGQTDLFGEAS